VNIFESHYDLFRPFWIFLDRFVNSGMFAEKGGVAKKNSVAAIDLPV
jgi:hypothetical protein